MQTHLDLGIHRGRTGETADGTLITWLFEPQDGGPKLIVNILEEDIAWWGSLLNNAWAPVLSRQVHRMLAAIKDGVEGQASTTPG